MQFIIKFSAFFYISVISSGLAGAQKSIDIDDVNITSKLLTGISVPNQEEITSNGFWRKHQEDMSKAWSRYKKSNLLPMKSWSEKHLSEIQQSKETLRYPFSGPDILHALYMFPDTDHYILCGLEPIGSVPESSILKGESSEQALKEIRTILEESLRFSFFKTLDMRAELSDAIYEGTLPIMCLFLSGAGYEIKKIEKLLLNKNGTVENLGTKKIRSDAVQITAEDQQGKPIKISYFKTNIANGYINKSGFIKYLESLPKGISYVKAASYLMHKNYFSEIRSHLLSSSSAIIQDDSGIPIKHFPNNRWNIQFFGKYTAPIDLFKEHYQVEMRDLSENQPIKLPFGTGYKWRKGQSNLILANHLKNGKPPKAILASINKLKKKPTPTPTPEKNNSSNQTFNLQSLDVRLRLLAKSVIDEETAKENKNAFIMNQYLIISNNTGSEELIGGKINVVRAGLINGRVVKEKPIGSIFSVKLSPLKKYPSLLNWTIKNDLTISKKETIYIPTQS
jgi:hypothetical protein